MTGVCCKIMGGREVKLLVGEMLEKYVFDRIEALDSVGRSAVKLLNLNGRAQYI